MKYEIMKICKKDKKFPIFSQELKRIVISLRKEREGEKEEDRRRND